ncbi:MAG TPA: EAL domain-containing protein [Usitatibacter sp.]|nr:EAL domain-containing protein [Usitatibacter sp.]
MARTNVSRKALSRLQEPVVVLCLVGCALLAVVWGMTFNMVRLEREGGYRAAASSAMELGDTYEAQVVRALREIDQSLRFIQHMHLHEGPRVDLADLKARGLLPPDLLFVVGVTDRAGIVLSSSRPSGFHDVTGEDFFRQQRGADTFFISRPRLGRDGEWKIDFSHRLSDARGGFDGVVFVTVAASYFVAGYEPSRLGAQGVLGLIGRDGIFRARRTGDAVMQGEKADYSTLLAMPADRLPAPVVNTWDHVRRYTVARELFEFPVAVVVGLSESEQMAEADERIAADLWRAGVASALLLALFAGLAALQWKLSHTRATADRALRTEVAIRRKAEAALNLRNRAVESSVNAVLISDLSRPGNPIEYVNPAFEKITGYSAGEVIGRDARFLFGGDTDQPAVLEIQKAIRERREARAVLRNYRKDGSPFWNEYSVAPVRDEDGNVTHFVEVMNDVTEAKTYEEQLAHQANFDGLTGLANRNLLQDRLQRAIATARRDGESLAVVFLDLDNFKNINDGLGHNVGDRLLKIIAARLQACVRENDTVSRHGGDEFVILLPEAAHSRSSQEAGLTVAVSKLLTHVSEPLALEGRQLRPTCSMGVSIFPHDGEDADTLLRNADAAMYRAKELGRNRMQFFTAEVHERIHQRMELESSLRLALEKQEFVLHYQPQVDLGHGGIVGIEALLRWRHPTRGLLYPGEFIAFAEETGLIVPIGEWVLNEACRQSVAWQRAGLPKVPVSVNMSALQCEQPDVVDMVRRALDASGLDANLLELEITESLSMANPGQSVPLMEALKSTGVMLAIDDFGTGFSNLSYLRRFPIDRLKIDLSFVRDIATDPGSLAISEAIISMSHNLKLQVVAEGVETEDQLALLDARQCDSIQGFYFSPPLASAPMAELLREGRRLAMPLGRRRQAARAVRM